MALDLSVLDQDDFNPTQANRAVAFAPLSSFEEDPGNPRFEDAPAEFEALVESIRAYGILQPIVVQTADDGRLRILFGSRRYRAAKQLSLDLVPCVVTADVRQLDEYAQVAENEKRMPLQPLELATFIAKRLAKGETRRTIADRLGINPSAVTHLLSLASDPSPFVLQLYHSRACRSPQYLYRLTKLWRIDARKVEEACSDVSEVGLLLIESIEKELQLEAGKASALVPDGHRDGVAKRVEAEVVALPSLPSMGSAAASVPLQPAEVERSVKASPEVMTSVSATPRLYGTFDGRGIELLLQCPSSHCGLVVARFAGDLIDTELDLAAIQLSRIVFDSK